MAEHRFFPVQTSQIHTALNDDLHGQTGNALVRAASVADSREHWLLAAEESWQTAKMKSDILSHPLYEQLLAAHVSCLKIGAFAYDKDSIEAQLANKHNVAIKYLILGSDRQLAAPNDKQELDKFMDRYTQLLRRLGRDLQEHLAVDAAQALTSYMELKQGLYELTGIMCEAEEDGESMEEGEEEDESNVNNEEMVDPFALDDLSCCATDHNGASLKEHIRYELKMELKEHYRENLQCVREEILRKRRAGRLDGDTSVLKSWWDAHAKWPYPTDEEKKKLMEQTGLEFKQINNWFINHRKRNWHTTTSTMPQLQSKRK